MCAVAAVAEAGGAVGVGDVAACLHGVGKLGAQKVGCARKADVDYADLHAGSVESCVVPGICPVDVGAGAVYPLVRGCLRGVGRDYGA